MNKLIIIVTSNNKHSKDTIVRAIFAQYLNRKINQNRFSIKKVSKEIILVDSFNNDKFITFSDFNNDIEELNKIYNVKIYNFEEPLKKLLIDLFGLDPIQCYGNDDDKNSQTHIMWDDFPNSIRKNHRRVRKGIKGWKLAKGNITAKDLYKVFGNEICSSIDKNCWARALYNTINKDNNNLCIIDGATNPNQICMGTEQYAKAIRIVDDSSNEKDELNDFPIGEYNLFVSSEDKTVEEISKEIEKTINDWFNTYKII